MLNELLSRKGQDAINCYSAYGVRIGVKASAALLKEIECISIACGQDGSDGAPDILFELALHQSGAGDLAYHIRENGGAVATQIDMAGALQWLGTRSEQYIAENCRSFVFVHAGVVGWRGKAIVVPGPSFSGKSTLILSLVDAGATYYSDEYAVLDPEGRVHAFPRIPRMRTVVAGQLVNTPLAGGPVGVPALPPLEVGLVLKTRYVPGAIWQPRPLTQGETLLSLLENTVSIRSHMERSITALKNVTKTARGAKAERGDAATAAAEVLRLLEHQCSDI